MGRLCYRRELNTAKLIWCEQRIRFYVVTTTDFPVPEYSFKNTCRLLTEYSKTWKGLILRVYLYCAKNTRFSYFYGIGSVKKRLQYILLLSRKLDIKVNQQIKPLNLLVVPHLLQYRPVENSELIFEGKSVEHSHSVGLPLLAVQLGSLRFTAENSGRSVSLYREETCFRLLCVILPTDGHDSVIKKALTTMYRLMAILCHVWLQKSLK